MRRFAMLALSLFFCAGCTAIVDAGGYTVVTCDPVTSDGCSAEETCHAFVTGERTCLPVGTRGVGETCSGLTDCVRGADCVVFAEPGRGLCLDYCNVDGDCGRQPNTLGCSFRDADGYGFCTQGCDPSDPVACGTGVACYAMGTLGVCNLTGPLNRADECGGTGFADSCAPGLMCLTNTSGAGSCFAQCGPRLPVCPEGLSCTFVVNDEIRPAEPDEWGACSF